MVYLPYKYTENETNIGWLIPIFTVNSDLYNKIVSEIV